MMKNLIHRNAIDFLRQMYYIVYYKNAVLRLANIALNI